MWSNPSHEPAFGTIWLHFSRRMLYLSSKTTFLLLFGRFPTRLWKTCQICSGGGQQLMEPQLFDA